jgi:hypothetical protein
MFATIKLERPAVGRRNTRFLSGIRTEKLDASRAIANTVAMLRKNSDFGFAGLGAPALADFILMKCQQSTAKSPVNNSGPPLPVQHMVEDVH